jgi:hypothetical protein
MSNGYAKSGDVFPTEKTNSGKLRPLARKD